MLILFHDILWAPIFHRSIRSVISVYKFTGARRDKVSDQKVTLRLRNYNATISRSQSWNKYVTHVQYRYRWLLDTLYNQSTVDYVVLIRLPIYYTFRFTRTCSRFGPCSKRPGCVFRVSHRRTIETQTHYNYVEESIQCECRTSLCPLTAQ